MLRGPPGIGYLCPRCDQPGHWATQCPNVASPGVARGMDAPSVAERDRAWFKTWTEERMAAARAGEAIVPPELAMKRDLDRLEAISSLLERGLNENERAAALDEAKRVQEAVQSVVLPTASRHDRASRKQRWRARRIEKKKIERAEAADARRWRIAAVEERFAAETARLAAEKKAAEARAASASQFRQVRRQIFTLKEQTSTLDALVKLRALRGEKARRKGHFDVVQDAAFDQAATDLHAHADGLLAAAKSKLADLKQALRLPAVPEPTPEPKLPPRKRKRRKANPFKRYYEQGSRSIAGLIRVRREWDAYLVPSVSPHLGSGIPPHFVAPPPFYTG